MLIYIVTSGEYSAYRIEAVFSTEERALAHLKRFQARQGPYTGSRIEEYDVDNATDPGEPVINFEWNIVFDRKGSIQAVQRLTQRDDPTRAIFRDAAKLRNLRVIAPNEETARRIAPERLAEYLAVNQRIT